MHIMQTHSKGGRNWMGKNLAVGGGEFTHVHKDYVATISARDGRRFQVIFTEQELCSLILSRPVLSISDKLGVTRAKQWMDDTVEILGGLANETSSD